MVTPLTDEKSNVWRGEIKPHKVTQLVGRRAGIGAQVCNSRIWLACFSSAYVRSVCYCKILILEPSNRGIGFLEENERLGLMLNQGLWEFTEERFCALRLP